MGPEALHDKCHDVLQVCRSHRHISRAHRRAADRAASGLDRAHLPPAALALTLALSLSDISGVAFATPAAAARIWSEVAQAALSAESVGAREEHHVEDQLTTKTAEQLSPQALCGVTTQDGRRHGTGGRHLRPGGAGALIRGMTSVFCGSRLCRSSCCTGSRSGGGCRSSSG